MKTHDQAVTTTDRYEFRDPDQEQVQPRRKIHLLSVGSVDHNHVLHDAFLRGRGTRSSQVSDCRELWLIPDYRGLWVMPDREAVHVAVLHDTLFPFELDEACRFIRHRWPMARILVVCTGKDFLDDALYDDRVMPGASAEVIVAAIENLLERRCT